MNDTPQVAGDVRTDASTEGAPHDQSAQPVRFTTRGDFVAVLDRLGLSLVVAAQPNRVILLGAMNGQLTTTTSFFSNPFGIAVDGNRLAVANRHAVFVLGSDPRLAAGYPGHPNRYDAFYVPRTIHITGGCATHDIIFARHAIIAANTTFSCVCRIDGACNFTPMWRPSFITELMADDRCHLNGFTGENEELSYVTALGSSNEPNGWRETVETGGVLIDARRNVILSAGLCLPHSPRLVGDELYLLNGGEGEVLRVDRGTGECTVLARLPAFTHGLCHHDGVLFVGMATNRDSRGTKPLPVARRLTSLVAGVAAVEIRSGTILGAVEFDGIDEVSDVQPLPGIRHAAIQSLVAADPYDGIITPSGVYWLRGAGNLSAASATGNYRVKLDIKVT